jgi:hypothetical protein
LTAGMGYGRRKALLMEAFWSIVLPGLLNIGWEAVSEQIVNVVLVFRVLRPAVWKQHQGQRYRVVCTPSLVALKPSVIAIVTMIGRRGRRQGWIYVLRPT